MKKLCPDNYQDILIKRLKAAGLRQYISIILLLLIFTSASARSMTDIAIDSLVKNHKVVYFGKGPEPTKDSTENMMRMFYEDQFRHSQDPLAPYFMFMSKDNQLAMGIGGTVRMRAYFDWGGSIPSSGFAPYMIPMQKDPTQMRNLGTTPAGTALYFRVLGMNKKLGSYQLYIEANFNGYQSRDFHLKKAYGQINDWTVGYTNSTFSDPGALPPAIDAQGPNAKMSPTAVLVRYLHAFKNKKWSIAASVEMPKNGIDVVPDTTAKVNQYIPDVAVYGQYQWSSKGHIRLAGIFRSHPYRDLLAEKNHSVTGWGVQLSLVGQPEDHITLYGAVNGGRGYASLGGDWLMGKYDLVSEPDKPGLMYSPGAVGGYAAIQYNINPSMYFSATYGATRYLPKDNGSPDEYKTGMYIAVNYFWNLTTRISCGAEFNLGRRENMDGQSAWARRVGAMVQFSF